MARLSDDAIAAARSASKKWRVPASVSLAQYIIESGWGAHSPGNNPFGMKPRKGRNDPQQILMTTEYSRLRGYYRVPQPFRKFGSLAEAFEAHAELIATAKVYAVAMTALPDRDLFIVKMAPRYATDPHYADKLRSVIKSAGLAQYVA